jgi:hypothetical protein
MKPSGLRTRAWGPEGLRACGGSTDRGAALIATLAIVMVLFPLGAFVVMQCRTDWLIHHNLRAEIEAFYVAEAGLEHALAEIAPGLSFDDVLAGPDHQSGTMDDGVFPFREGAVSDFPHPPFRYEVHVTAAGTGMIQVTSHGSGHGESTKVVEALVVRSPLPFTPAAVYAGGALSDLDLGGLGFAVSGFDHVVGDAPAAARGTAAPVPALAGPLVDPDSLALALSGRGAQLLTGAGTTPSIGGSAAAVDLAAFVAASAGQRSCVWVSAAATDAALVLGTAAAPQLSIVPGNLDVGQSLTGCGVLVVQGVLHVSGAMAFAGLVVAMGGVVFDPSSTVTVTGALWDDTSRGGRMQLSGRGAILYSSAALAAVDAGIPGLLPRAAVLVGWQEQL